MPQYDAVVVGGGIVGSAVAYHLTREGVATLLVDREDEGRATDAGAGIVSPATSSRTDDPAWFEFALDAAAYYPELADELASVGHDHGYAATDLLSVAVGADEHEAFEAARERTERRTAEYGRPDPGSVTEIDPDRASELFPPLATEDVRALRYENAARVDGRQFADALRAAAADDGLDTLDDEVTRIATRGRRVVGVDCADAGRVRADDVVVAGGAWSGSFECDLGVEIPVEPHRGQIAHVDAGRTPVDRPTAEWPLVKGFRGHYLVPWPDGRVAVGATRETDSGFTPHVTLGGLREVSSEALRLAPGLADARHLETRVGLRPVAADRRPVLGPVPGVEGAHLATGHGATGLQLGPFSGKVVADCVRGASPAVDLDPFRVDRFSEEG